MRVAPGVTDQQLEKLQIAGRLWEARLFDSISNLCWLLNT
jgi:hypothetical protein